MHDGLNYYNAFKLNKLNSTLIILMSCYAFTQAGTVAHEFGFFLLNIPMMTGIDYCNSIKNCVKYKLFEGLQKIIFLFNNMTIIITV